jgi:hypothetical protein
MDFGESGINYARTVLAGLHEPRSRNNIERNITILSIIIGGRSSPNSFEYLRIPWIDTFVSFNGIAYVRLPNAFQIGGAMKNLEVRRIRSGPQKYLFISTQP